jgi:hypothetical protein
MKSRWNRFTGQGMCMMGHWRMYRASMSSLGKPPSQQADVFTNQDFLQIHSSGVSIKFSFYVNRGGRFTNSGYQLE